MGQGKPDVPGAVARAAGAGGFGDLREVHAPGGPVAGIGAMVVSLLFWGVFFALGVVLNDGSASWFWFVLIGVALMVPVVVHEVSAGRRRDRPHYYVFAGGLVRHRRGEATAWAWDDVEYVERASYTGGAQGGGGWSYSYLLRSHHGLVEIPLPGHLEGVATGIAGAVLARARAALHRGGTVRFGAVEAGPDGLTVDGETMPWRTCDGAATGREFVEIYQRDPRRPWKRLPVGAVPDARALVSLAGERVRGPSVP
ncbi:hypothetical protein J2S43_002521 [Catenuloplanes nepalensis]|uniref:Uncharacterized protein n=1 Tax=Catenuloplanes nepalensis TaxID=587533 RepID=A0ABT9MRF6_9ACTN|nr:hypothetical protein [Catenuloplanes nepalensis]MDP9794009.1 hypothetical protein [Catenuloplanes nepalensis]